MRMKSIHPHWPKEQVDEILYINSLRPCVRDHWTQRKVTVDTEKSDEKKKNDGRRREK